MIWYPYQQMKTMKEPYHIVDAQGVYLYTREDKLIDSASSWWSVIHGYKHPELNRAIQEQTERFAHVMLGGLTHEPVEKLSQSWRSGCGGPGLLFFSDSGSVAVEVALKRPSSITEIRAAPAARCSPSPHAYHGDTFKTMEVGTTWTTTGFCGRSGTWFTFRPKSKRWSGSLRSRGRPFSALSWSLCSRAQGACGCTMCPS